VDWRRAQPPASVPLDDWWTHCLDGAPDPFETAAERDQAERLFAHVEGLDEPTRQTVHLHYYRASRFPRPPKYSVSPPAR
jgi:hypothetical protein